jgi:tungstate transport system ATP-binding protein
MLYELNRVIRQFGQRIVLDIDRLSFESRKVYALIGPNGAGKTTLLNQLAFLDQPSSGDIFFRSARVSYERALLTRLRRQVVLVDQSPILFSGTVWKNIEFGLKVRKICGAEKRLKIEQALERVGLTDFAQVDVHGLSGGEVKRVALARALALEPEVLLCDEPTANVDQEHQEIILKILDHANSIRNTTVIFSTHYLSQSRRLAHHTLLLQNGSLARHLDENSFNGSVVAHGDKLQFRLADRYLLPLAESTSAGPPGRAARAHIDSTRIKLMPATDGNQITGKIVSISSENGRVRLMVDIGVRLQVVMQAEDFQEQPFQVLQPVGVVLESGSVRLIS